jgi:hypothetical protein
LEESERSDVVRAEAVLDDRLDLPLEVDLQKRAVQNEEEREPHGDNEAERRPDERIDAERTHCHD